MTEAHSATCAADEDQASTRPTLGDILRQYGPAYRRKYADRMSREQLQALDHLERCLMISW